MNDCYNCLKKDVCNQKQIVAAVQKALASFYVPAEHNGFYSVSQLMSNYKIKVGMHCDRYVYSNHLALDD